MIIRIYDAGQRKQQKSGYGVMAYQLSRNLGALGHKVLWFPRNDGVTEDVTLWLRPPHYIKYNEFAEGKLLGIPQVFYTMHELDHFPGWKCDWPGLLNRTNHIITPTEWNKQVFRDKGVTVPITVVPLGINTNDYHGLRPYRCSFLSVFSALGSDSSREDWKDTIEAFLREFKGKYASEVVLTLKSWNTKPTEYRRFIDATKKDIGISSKWRGDDPYFPEIRVVEIDLELIDMNALYGSHHVFVKAANREGWSLPLYEAMASDCRVIYSDIPIFQSMDIPGMFGVSYRHGSVDDLRAKMHGEFREWKKRKGWINQFKWSRCAEQVATVLHQEVVNVQGV